MNKFQKQVVKETKKSDLIKHYKSFRILRILMRACIKDDIIEKKYGQDALFKSVYYNKNWKYADKVL